MDETMTIEVKKTADEVITEHRNLILKTLDALDEMNLMDEKPYDEMRRNRELLNELYKSHVKLKMDLGLIPLPVQKSVEVKTEQMLMNSERQKILAERTEKKKTKS